MCGIQVQRVLLGEYASTTMVLLPAAVSAGNLENSVIAKFCSSLVFAVAIAASQNRTIIPTVLLHILPCYICINDFRGSMRSIHSAAVCGIRRLVSGLRLVTPKEQCQLKEKSKGRVHVASCSL